MALDRSRLLTLSTQKAEPALIALGINQWDVIEVRRLFGEVANSVGEVAGQDYVFTAVVSIAERTDRDMSEDDRRICNIASDLLTKTKWPD